MSSFECLVYIQELSSLQSINSKDRIPTSFILVSAGALHDGQFVGKLRTCQKKRKRYHKIAHNFSKPVDLILYLYILSALNSLLSSTSLQTESNV